MNLVSSFFNKKRSLVHGGTTTYKFKSLVIIKPKGLQQEYHQYIYVFTILEIMGSAIASGFIGSVTNLAKSRIVCQLCYIKQLFISKQPNDAS